MKYNKKLTKKDKIDKELDRINKEIKNIKIHGGAMAPSVNESIFGNYNYSVDHLLSNKINLNESIFIFPKNHDKSIFDFIPENERPPIDYNRFCYGESRIAFENVEILEWKQYSYSETTKFIIPNKIKMDIIIKFAIPYVDQNYIDVNFIFNTELNKGVGNTILIYNFIPNNDYNLFNIIIKVLFYKSNAMKAKNNIDELSTTLELEINEKCGIINTKVIDLSGVSQLYDKEINIKHENGTFAVTQIKADNIKKYIRYDNDNNTFLGMIIMPQAQGSLDKIINSFNLKDKKLLFNYILKELKCLAEYTNPKIYLDIKPDQLLYFTCPYGLKLILADLGGIYNPEVMIDQTRSIWSMDLNLQRVLSVENVSIIRIAALYENIFNSLEHATNLFSIDFGDSLSRNINNTKTAGLIYYYTGIDKNKKVKLQTYNKKTEEAEIVTYIANVIPSLKNTLPCSNYFKNEITKRLYKFRNSYYYKDYSKYNILRKYILFYLNKDLITITIADYIELINKLIHLINFIH